MYVEKLLFVLWVTLALTYCSSERQSHNSASADHEISALNLGQTHFQPPSEVLNAIGDSCEQLLDIAQTYDASQANNLNNAVLSLEASLGALEEYERQRKLYESIPHALYSFFRTDGSFEHTHLLQSSARAILRNAPSSLAPQYLNRDLLQNALAFANRVMGNPGLGIWDRDANSTQLFLALYADLIPANGPPAPGVSRFGNPDMHVVIDFLVYNIEKPFEQGDPIYALLRWILDKHINRTSFAYLYGSTADGKWHAKGRNYPLLWNEFVTSCQLLNESWESEAWINRFNGTNSFDLSGGGLFAQAKTTTESWPLPSSTIFQRPAIKVSQPCQLTQK